LLADSDLQLGYKMTEDRGPKTEDRVTEDRVTEDRRRKWGAARL